VALRKTTFYVAYVKMTKFGIKISFFVTHFLSFLHSQKLSVFHETVREHIEYRNIHADIFTKFLNFFFPGKGSICTRVQKCISVLNLVFGVRVIV
jgi:hypothetical protein